MDFNRHSNLAGAHAFLSASKYHWVNYDEDRLRDRYETQLAAAKGTELHAIASACIENKIKLFESSKTLNMYVNDAIGFRMSPEVTLLYSLNAFGTADTISFDGDLLRIHDLKTGVSKPSMTQLKIYSALFALEYQIEPESHDTELRIYQNDDIDIFEPSPREIREIMAKIILFDRVIEEMKANK